MAKYTANIVALLILLVILSIGCSRSDSGPRTTSTTGSIKGQFIGPKELVDAGNTTPEAAFETCFWAESKGDYDAVMAFADPQTQADAREWLGEKATFGPRSRMKFASFVGLQILASKKVASDRVELKYQFSFQNRQTPQITKIIEMVNVGGAWRGGHTRAYDASWDDGSQPEPTL